ncbi:hypothetical protein [Lacipirellula parvula]|uniref:Uncharacterized protein n=1 Tax=Lacipirellula parvula TaxID=2650471 RepID=A0A5K7X5J4_9BACT|nr:hypothetical protein [Lacipirellula parvula]BBO31800.1 hypothetical protein PLANPX_1412 [Lacipirellula parvula]
MAPILNRSTIVALLLLGAGASTALAQQAPTYARMRQGADDWSARGGGFGYSFPSYMYGGFFPTFSPPVLATQSWYQRPYPGHFDVARQRWGGPPPQQMQQSMGGQGYPAMMPRSDCPCADQPTPAQ